ncbi:MAG: metal ABC transporter permease [Schleiferiaceae bacterium]|nr:metal ABC transporter permease [Schleiferiaceae bacterium]
MDGLIIILVGAMVAVSCGWLGSFLILRKTVMIGDAISHAVLPGIVLAYLVSGSRDATVMLIGAALFGVFCTVLIELFHKRARLQEDASIGISFTFLFAIGVILISLFSGQVDLDQECVLYGEIAYAPLQVVRLASGVTLGAKALWVNGLLLLVVTLFVIFGYKGLFITSFHEDYAAARGVRTRFWHFALMGMVSFATVIAFESVGAILVVAFLVAPPATAYLITERLPKLLLWSAVFGITSAALGYLLAFAIDGSIAGAMATVCGVQFGVVFLGKKMSGRGR